MSLSKRGRKAFTLVELLVAMAILGVLVATLYTSFKGGTNSWTAGNARSQRAQNARAVLEIMSRDLKQAFTKDSTEYPGTFFQFQGFEGVPSDADSVYFTAASNCPKNANTYDLAEVGYYLNAAARSIYRIEEETIDSDLTNGTPTEELAPHVIGLDLKYNDGTGWSANGDYTKSTAPKAVEIILTIEDEDQIESPRDFKTIVYIP